jgi:hypothetical protein
MSISDGAIYLIECKMDNFRQRNQQPKDSFKSSSGIGRSIPKGSNVHIHEHYFKYCTYIYLMRRQLSEGNIFVPVVQLELKLWGNREKTLLQKHLHEVFYLSFFINSSHQWSSDPCIK